MSEVLSVPWGKQRNLGLHGVKEGKDGSLQGEEHPHAQWMPAESKTGQDSSGLIRQRTPELKSGGRNITFFLSIQSIGTTRSPVKLPGEKPVR